MEKNHKRYLRAVLVIILTAFCAMELPHTDKSIIEFIIPPIKLSRGSRLYLSGLVIIFPLWWSYREIVNSNYFDRSRIKIFILMFFILIPILFEGINIIKIPYYMFNRGLRTIEVVDSNFNFQYNSESNIINTELHLKNYSNDKKEFNVSIVLPESLNEVISDDILMLSNKYSIGPHQDYVFINELIEYSYTDGFNKEDIFDTHYHYDSYIIILYNENDKLIVRQDCN